MGEGLDPKPEDVYRKFRAAERWKQMSRKTEAETNDPELAARAADHVERGERNRQHQLEAASQYAADNLDLLTEQAKAEMEAEQDTQSESA